MSGIVGGITARSKIINYELQHFRSDLGTNHHGRNTDGSSESSGIRASNETKVSDGLVAWYKDGDSKDYWKNKLSGTNTNLTSANVTGNDHGGTDNNINAPWLGVKKTTVYPSSGGYAVLPLGTIVTGKMARTITMFINPNSSLSSSSYLFGFGGGGTGQSFNARCGGEQMGFMGNGADYDNAGAAIFNNATLWTRIWYTYTGSHVATFYTRDGIITTNWTQALSLTTPTSGTRTASIGGHATGPSGNNSMNSNVRDFRIYDRNLSTAEMSLMWDE
jgi:hypothetical protein